MAGLDTRFRALWFGTAATIPTDWSRDTDYDAVYFEGDDVDVAASGGGANHLHAGLIHSHGGNGHTHSVSAASASPSVINHFDGSGGGGISTFAASPHAHGAVASAAATSYWDSSGALSTSTTVAEPPYAKAIIIKPDDGDQLVPTGAVTFWEDDADPIRTRFCDGTNNVPDLRDKFIKGADALGDGDATSPLGSATHDHTANHTHDETAHTHIETSANFASSTLVGGDPAVAGILNILRAVHHSFSLDANAPTTTSNSASVDIDTTSSLAAYVRLACIQQLSGDQALHTGMILLWIGDAADLPDDWLLCDGTGGTIDTTDKQIYVVSTKSQVGDTGGADSHTHTGGSHTHTVTSSTHTHAATVLIGRDRRDNTSPYVTPAVSTAKAPHSHSWTVTNAARSLLGADPGDPDTADVRLPWKGVVFAKYEPVVTTSILGETSILGTTAIAAA